MHRDLKPENGKPVVVYLQSSYKLEPERYRGEWADKLTYRLFLPCDHRSRDLVPFDENGTVKVADFGLAKVLDGGRTSTRTLVGVSLSLSESKYGGSDRELGEAILNID